VGRDETMTVWISAICNSKKAIVLASERIFYRVHFIKIFLYRRENLCYYETDIRKRYHNKKEELLKKYWYWKVLI